MTEISFELAEKEEEMPKDHSMVVLDTFFFVAIFTILWESNDSTKFNFTILEDTVLRA